MKKKYLIFGILGLISFVAYKSGVFANRENLIKKWFFSRGLDDTPKNRMILVDSKSNYQLMKEINN